jgi:hypothetical protein
VPASTPRPDRLAEIEAELDRDGRFEVRLYAARMLLRAGLRDAARAQIAPLERQAGERAGDVAWLAAQIDGREPDPATIPPDDLEDRAEEAAIALAATGQLEAAERWAEKASAAAAWEAVARGQAAAGGDPGPALTRAERAGGADDRLLTELAALHAELGRAPEARKLARRIHRQITRSERFYASAADPILLARAAVGGRDRDVAQDVANRLWDSGVTNESPAVRLQAAAVVREHGLAPPPGEGDDPAAFADRAVRQVEDSLAAGAEPEAVVRDGILAQLARARHAAGELDRAREHAAAITDAATRVLTRIALLQ